MTRKTRTLTLAAAMAVAIVCGVLAQPQGESAPKVVEITNQETLGVGDLASALRIRKVSGTYRLSEKVKEVDLVLRFYHGGELVESAVAVSSSTSADRATDSGAFALQIVDLDYLPLADATTGHHRLHYELASPDGSHVASRMDLSKSKFDVTTTFASFAFRPQAGAPGEAPLFAIIGGPVKSTTSSSTPGGVVQSNPGADILIAVLKFRR